MEEQFIHWLAHMQTDMFVYMITHIETEEEARVYVKQAICYLVSGWYGMFGMALKPPGEK